MPYGKENCEKKEKLHVTSNFSYSHNVFHSYRVLVSQNAALCDNGLTLYRTTPTINDPKKEAF